MKNHRKFYTTLTDHDLGRITYGIPKSDKVGAADPNWLNQWIEANGPYLFHSTEPSAKEKILQEGLIPHDRGPGSIYDADLVPRRNHSYLQTYPHWSDHAKLLGIDLRKINPRRLNGDEDAFASEKDARRWGLPIPDARRLPYGYDVDEYTGEEDRNRPFHVKELHAPENQFTTRYWNNLGHWADDVGIYLPEQTAHSLNYHSTVAVEGGVPSDALLDGQDAYDHMHELLPNSWRQVPWGGGFKFQKHVVPYSEEQSVAA